MGWEDRSYYREGRGAPGGGVVNWLLSGSVPLFTAFGIRVRAHSSLVLYVIFVLVFGLGENFSWQDRFQNAGVLFLIVLLHEFGHCFTARWVGGHAEDILMTPIGGLAFAHPPRRPLPTFLTVAGGPAVNVLICIVSGAVCLGVFHVLPWNPLNFVSPEQQLRLRNLSTGWWYVGSYAIWVYEISWFLFVFNLWPVFPLDGGQMLQAILWPRIGYYRSMKFAAVTGMIGAVVMAIVGVVSGNFWLIFIAAGGFMYAHYTNQQLKYAGPGGIDVPDEVDYAASIYAKDPKPRRKKKSWFARRAATLEEEQAEQRKIDAILAKVSAHGMNSLTWNEKRALRQATEKQRKRDLEMERRLRK